MSAAPLPAEPTPAQRALDDERLRQAAYELIELGLSFARMLHSQAEAPPLEPDLPKPDLPKPDLPKPDLPTLAAAFDSVSRGVRRTILLARKLAEPLPQPRHDPAADGTFDGTLDRTGARKRIIREVEDAIYRNHRRNRRDVETLEAELLDRLDRPDLEDDLATRPLEHIIADLARDLGVGSPLDETFRIWKPRTKQDIATLEARAAASLPTEPPARTASPIPLPELQRIELPEDDAEAVAMVLAIGKIRDG